LEIEQLFYIIYKTARFVNWIALPFDLNNQEAKMGTIMSGHQMLNQMRIRRGLIFGAIIIGALLAFETFNYSTTEFALSDLLGELKFAGIRWATILSIAFCGIDFAGIARLFTPSEGSGHGSGNPNETWYLFGAWLLAATMNAMLTWWGVSLAVIGHQTLGNEVVSRTTLLRVVPIFVALLVWLIRVLIIGTFSVAGDHLFTQDDARVPRVRQNQLRPGAALQPSFTPAHNRPQGNRSFASPANSQRTGMKTAANIPVEPSYSNHAEPTDHPLSASAAKPVVPSRPDPSRPGPSFRNS
jgi:hypothetical protein